MARTDRLRYVGNALVCAGSLALLVGCSDTGDSRDSGLGGVGGSATGGTGGMATSGSDGAETGGTGGGGGMATGGSGGAETGGASGAIPQSGGGASQAGGAGGTQTGGSSGTETGGGHGAETGGSGGIETGGAGSTVSQAGGGGTSDGGSGGTYTGAAGGNDTGGSGGSSIYCDDFWGSTDDIPAAANVLTFKFLNRTNGAFPDEQVWWSFRSGDYDELHTIAEEPYYDMPANSSGRMYFYLGTDDRESDYADFIEFTIGDNAFHGNTTEVDGVALKIAIRLHCADGYDVQVGRTCETFEEDRAATWQAFKDYTPPEFDHLAEREGNRRILNPGWGEFSEGGLYENYWDAYVDEVWAIHNPGYAKPGAYLAGLGSEPSMSAALHRHTAHLPKDQWEDESQFYLEAPANFYAAFWHSRSIDNRSYGFPYDDVGGYSTYISHSDPEWLLVAIGF